MNERNIQPGLLEGPAADFKLIQGLYVKDRIHGHRGKLAVQGALVSLQGADTLDELLILVMTPQGDDDAGRSRSTEDILQLLLDQITVHRR